MENPSSLEEDQKLVEAINRGDQAAANRLVEKYQDRLYFCLLKIVQHPEDALDVVQESFLSALKSMNRYKGKSQFFTWLYRIGINAAINHQRKSNRHQTFQSQLSQVHLQQTAAQEERAAQSQPLAAAELADEVEKVRKGLEMLGPEFKAVLVLKEIEDLDYHEIAEIMKTPVGTVRSRLHRARQELRWILEQLGQVEHPSQGTGESR